MRRFLVEMENEITMDDIRAEYERRKDELREDNGVENLDEFLDLCMDWNDGSLTEILTEDTPCWRKQFAVELCEVNYAEPGEPDDLCVEWLNTREQIREAGRGHRIRKL